MILVTGANGHLGSQTIDFLLDKDSGEKIAGLVRSEEKGAELKEKGVEIRIGDYTDYPSIEEAVQGVDTLLLISSSTLEGRAQQHENVIQAAKNEGVDQIFYTSIVKAEEELSPLSPDHFQTEKLLKNSGIIPFTGTRSTWNFCRFFWATLWRPVNGPFPQMEMRSTWPCARRWRRRWPTDWRSLKIT